MNAQQARALVFQTFPQTFDKARFRNFAINLLNHIDETKAAPMAVPDAFAPHVRSCSRLGTYESPGGELADVLIVNTTEPWKLERTRTALRDFVAHKLKRQDSYKEAGLVAFVSPGARSWRFSYVRMEYETKRDPKTGKIAVEERLTPARRFSYLVGEGESCHTAQSRFLNLLQDTENNPSLAQIEDAFSVEAVTKEFFNKYAELFGEIHKALEKLVAKEKTIADEFKEKNVSTVDFAKKLMGQIVFLYFLQKKGWLGVEKGKDWGTGPHDFLRRLAKGEYGPYDNFFNDVLEPLFYDTLATDRGHEAWCNHFKCRIPFLNGGLFEPLANYDWRKIDIILPNRLFTNTGLVEEGITGTGVLDVFDRYNFTVNEAEPLEKEVAIDPEMLGKVFENLIEENRRKGLGAFYTPREIVHYMCQESLINYLDSQCGTGIPACDSKTPQTRMSVPRADLETFIHLGEQISHYEAVETKYRIKMPPSIEKYAGLIDEKLAEITVCDPAAGSAAFLVGMMNEIVRARSALTPYFKGDTDILVCAEGQGQTGMSVSQTGDTGIPACAPEIRITRRNLPHWTRDGAIYWITFRLADSLPKEKLDVWSAEHKTWLSQHPKPWTEAERLEYHERFTERMQTWLDAGYGSCALARPELRQIVQDSLLRFNGQRLRLHAGVVMPNHVHLLLEAFAGQQLSELLKGIKGASARKINQLLGKTGETFWMDESYDHIVRNEEEYQRFRGYIASNPVKANLSPGQFWLHSDTDIPVCVLGEAQPQTQTRMSVSRTPYHFKRHAIQNSLYGVDIDAGAVEIAKLRLWLSLVVDEEDVKEIKPLPNLDYKVVVGDSLIGLEEGAKFFEAVALRELEQLKAKHFDEIDHAAKEKRQGRIDKLLEQVTHGVFDFCVHFSEVFSRRKGFDVVMANPPYIFARESKKKGLTEENKRYFYEHYELAEYQVNLYPLFIEKGTRLLRPGGCLCFITPNNWLTINTNKTMRQFVLGQSDITLVNFYARVFESADVDSSIILFRKSEANRRCVLFEYTDGFHFIKEAPSDFFLKQRGYVINIEAFKAGGTAELIRRIEGKSLRLGDIADVKVGLGAYGIGRGIPPQTEQMIENRVYHSTRKASQQHFKYINGRDVCRYYIGWSGEYLKYGDHLREPRRDWRLFSTNRVLVRQIPAKPPYCICASLTDETFLNDRNSMNVINIREKPEYVLGVLNSRLVSWWFVNKFGKMQRETFPQFKVNELADFPLPKNGEKHRDEIAKLSGQILAAKRKDAAGDTTEWEREIDRLVYTLYGLTADEVKIVEGSVK